MGSFQKNHKIFFLAAVSDPDTPTDVGIFKTMYETAYKEKIKYVFNGHSFQTEGIEPLDWTYMDGKYIENIHKKFGDGDLRNFDNFYISDLVKSSFSSIYLVNFSSSTIFGRTFNIFSASIF